MASGHNDHKHPLYVKRSRVLRAAANADPSTRCWRCGRTKAEHQSRWTAGHMVHGDTSPDGPLAPECWRCMCSSGAKYGNELRGTPSKRDPVTPPGWKPVSPVVAAVGDQPAGRYYEHARGEWALVYLDGTFAPKRTPSRNWL